MDRRIWAFTFCWLGLASLAFAQTPVPDDDAQAPDAAQEQDDSDRPPASPRRSGPTIYQGTDGEMAEEMGPDSDYGSPYDSYGPVSGGCSDGCCDAGGSCDSGHCGHGGYANCQGGGFWGRLETLGWWVRGSQLPVLVTTSPQGTAQASAGVLPSATEVFGNERVDGEGRIGGRVTIGYWTDDCETAGADGNFWGLEDKGTHFRQSSNGNPILARPFFNTQTRQQDAGLTAFPGFVTGTIDIRTSSEVLGGEANLRHMVYKHCNRRVDAIAGYRFFRMDEDLTINDFNTSIDPISNIPVGTTFNINDAFSTENEFHGGQLGLLMQYKHDCWALNIGAKVALGNMLQRVNIAGSTRIEVPGATAVDNEGGFLALGSNSGEFSHSRFSVIPEFGINLAWNVSCLWTANIGYNFIYVTNVARPGDQIDLNIDPNQFPPAISGNQPAFAFNDTDVWIQGINIGLGCRF